MTATSQTIVDPIAEALAKRVVEDIYDRGLTTGDRYLTGDQACDNFNVGKALLNNAFKLLADRQYLIRKRKAGTYVGPMFPAEATRESVSDAMLDVIHVLMPMDYYRANLIPGRLFVEHLNRIVAGVSVQVHHIADNAVHNYTVDLLAQLERVCGGRRDGLILIRSPRETQTAVQQSGLPAVVFGSTYPHAKQLCSIDLDQEQAGRLSAEVALDNGHERFAMIMRNHWRRGDNLLMEGFAGALGKAGVGVDRVSIVSAPEDPRIIEHEVAALLAQDPHPTALVCRSRFHAEAAVRGIRDRGLVPGSDVLVIATQPGVIPGAEVAYCIEPCIEAALQIERVGEALTAIATGQDAQAYSQRIAMKTVRVTDTPGRAAATEDP